MNEVEQTVSLRNNKQLVDFSSLANLIAIGVPALILVGVSYKYGFYSEAKIDATWVISLFGPTDLIFASTETLLFYIAAFFYMTKLFDSDATQTLKEFWLQFLVLLVLALSSYVFYDLEIRSFLYILFSFIGFYLLIYRQSFGKIMGAVIVAFIPYDNGVHAARMLDNKSLPIVILDESKPKDTWYLLDKYGDKAILLKTGKVASQNKFKIIEVKEIKLIENNSN